MLPDRISQMGREALESVLEPAFELQLALKIAVRVLVVCWRKLESLFQGSANATAPRYARC